MMKIRALLLLFLVVLWNGADGYGGGAPGSPGICETMLPGHGADPQTSPSPFTISISNDKPLGGDVVKITLTAPSDTYFKGFLVVVKKPGDDKSAFGKFNVSSDPDAQAIGCFGKTHSAMTHNSPKEKKKVTLQWIAPNEEDIAELQLVVTFVRKGSEIWKSIIHPQKLSVKKNLLAVAATPLKAIGNEVRQKLKENYQGCDGDTKGCLGLGSSSCIQDFISTQDQPIPTTCLVLLSWRADGDRNVYNLSGTPGSTEDVTGYIAIGLSEDKAMGTDSVAACYVDTAGSIPSVHRFYNNGKNNGKHDDPFLGLPRDKMRNSHQEGYLFCSFEQIDHTVGGINIQIRNKNYYILLAQGAAGPSGLSQHVQKAVSGEALAITDTGTFETKDSRILIQLHGAFMIIAWLLCASTGMFTARYYKLTHTDVMPFNKAFWFVLHLFCMFSTVFLTVCGAIFIFIKKGGYYPEDGKYWHPILGIILFCLALFQVLLALCRPHPNTKRRPLFNWIHWTVGNSAHIVGIACIFLANDLDAANLKKDEYLFIMLGAVIFHVVMHLIMSFHTLWADKQMDSKTKRAVTPGPMKPNGLTSEAPGTGFRTFMLALYFIGLCSCAVALVIYVCKPVEISAVDS